jgi:uncharacterized membrane protein
MKHLREFVVNALVGGLLVLTPIYLAGLLLLKAMQTAAGLVKPLARVLPEGLPAEKILSLLLVLIVCFLVGLAVRTPFGKTTQARTEKWLLRRVPGYGLFRSLTQRLAGMDQEKTWQPALAEIEDALVPAFIIEELDDGRFTVFVPAVPTPLSGSVYILTAERVHPLSASFAQAFKAVSRWGVGSKDLVAAMRSGHPSSEAEHAKRI